MEFIDVSSTTSHKEPPEPVNLLEECWFFGNLLSDSKLKMTKSYSDLDPSPNYNTQEEMPVIRSKRSSSETTMKDPKGNNFDHRKLAKAPSLPSYMEPKVFMFDQIKEKHGSGGFNLRPQNNLIREQSLPSGLRREEKEDEDEDEESDFTLGRLIRQASLKSAHILPPRHNSKAPSSRFQTNYCPSKRTDQPESNNMDMRAQYPSDGTKIRRSSSDIQENCRDKTKEKMINNYSPTIPNWYDNEKRSSQDMKAEIKSWARAVASNVASPSPVLANRN